MTTLSDIQRGALGLATADSPMFTAVNVGNASDTTVSRASAGDIQVEANIVYRAGGTDVAVTDGGTGASTFTDGGVLIGKGTAAFETTGVLADGTIIIGDGVTNPTTLAAFSSSTGTLKVANGGTGAATLALNNVVLGNGTSAVQVVAPGGSGNVLTSNGTTWASTALSSGAVTTFTAGTTGLTPSSPTAGAVTLAGTLAVANGGTGASTAAVARTNLGLGSIATQAASSVSITGGSITGITDLAVADGGTGGSDASTARSNLGLGSIATQAASSVSITGGSITGITDLAVADGGTGGSTAAAARTNLVAASYYTGTTLGLTDYPIGSVILVDSATNPPRNSTSNIYLTTGSDSRFSLTSGSAQLSGTWNARGFDATGDTSLWQRTA